MGAPGLAPLTQVGGIVGRAEFIQDVTSLPMLDDWAKRFGSQRAVDPEELEEESVSELRELPEQETDGNLNLSSYSRSLCWAGRHNADENRHSLGTRGSSEGAGSVVRNKVHLTPHPHLNGLSGTQLGLSSGSTRITELTSRTLE